MNMVNRRLCNVLEVVRHIAKPSKEEIARVEVKKFASFMDMAWKHDRVHGIGYGYYNSPGFQVAHKDVNYRGAE